jgi:hypothetical protein
VTGTEQFIKGTAKDLSSLQTAYEAADARWNFAARVPQTLSPFAGPQSDGSSGLALVSNEASRWSLPPAAKDDPKDRFRARLAAGAV